MRQIAPTKVQERKKKLLQAVIHHYIKTAKPVSSNIITSDYGFDLSPATIRNLMVELEDEGFLTHPHTSAGRVPTDKGYRLYVDSLIELQKFVISEGARVQKEYEQRKKELDNVLSMTSKALSSLSHYSGFVITPKIESNMLKFIELTQVSEHKLLVLFVTHTGLVKHKLIDATVPAEKLYTLNRILNDNLKDLSLLNVKQKIYEILDTFEREQREIIAIARKLSGQMFDIDDEIYLDGTNNVLELPEFHDYESMRCLLNIREDKDRIIGILSNVLKKNDVNVIIGSETTCTDLQNLSVVTSVYRDGDNAIGMLGIIGPKRMEYARMMALVSAVSKVVNKLLSKEGG